MKVSIIPRSSPAVEPHATAAPQALTSVNQLLQRLELAPEAVESAAMAAFPLRVPSSFLRRIRPGDPSDPLLRQILPTRAEQFHHHHELSDPVGDGPAQRSPGVLQKYPGRALLITTGACPIHCRYCFRREYPYGEASVTPAHLREALNTLRADTTLHEVILSGGDPLSLSDRRIGSLLRGLESIPHLRTLRIHTRFPVVSPERINPRLLELLQRSRLHTVVVVHANHAREIDDAVEHALRRLRRAGILLLNQSVLLAAVNDDADILTGLSHRLWDAGVLPYYLHMLDAVRGTHHFRVSDERARALLAALRARLPGYLVPRLVREQPGALSKQPL